MKKRIISLFLALALCVGMLPAPAWAEEPTDPTQAVEVVGAANPSEETDPTTEPTEEETEPTEEGTEPTEEGTEPTEEETEPTEVQILEEPVGEVAAFGADSTEDVAMLEAGGKTTYYASVNAAIDAATEEKTGTVTLLDDAALENSDGESYFNHTNKGTDLTIVLDGHTLTGNMEDGSYDAQLTIDGTKSGSTFSGSIKFSGKGNVLTINGGTYQNDAGDFALEFWGRSMQLNITAGEFKNRLQFSCEWDSENGGYIPLNVTGGTFCGITNDGDETLGATLTLCRKAPYCFMDGSQKIKLSDLGLSTDRTLTVAECTEHTYETDETQENCEYCGKRNPQKPPENAVATVDGEFYSTLLGAIQAADTSGKSVVLCKDQRLPDDGLLRLDSYTVTIDLNGKELAVQQGLPILVTGGNVTLTNSQPTGKIAASGNNGSAIQVQGGSLTVKENVQVEGVSYGGHIYPAIEVTDGTVRLYQGATLVNGIQAPEGHTIAEYLAEGSAYAANGRVTNGYVQGTTDTLTVVEHSNHSFQSTGSCACGRSCDHSTVSDVTGLCQKCGSQVYEANVTTADGTVTGYRTLEEALRNGADATVKLLADCVEGTEEAFYVTVPLTLDLNGKRMEGPSGLVVKKGPTTIQDSAPAKTGTIAGTKDWEYSGVGLWVFKDAEVTLTILGGHFEGKTDGLQLAGQNTLILKGGSFSGIHFIEGAAATLRDALAPGYAYYKADNTLYDPGDKQEATVKLHVGAHPEHTPDSSGHCPCGYTVAAMLETEAGKQYFADFSDALEAAKAASGSTLTLLRDVTHSGDSSIYIDGGTFTIDWNGHTLSGGPSYYDLMVITDSANVTLRDGSNTNTGGARQTDLGAAVSIAVRSEGSVKIQGGTYSPNVTRSQRCYGSVQISGGVFENPEDHGRNCALYNASGSLSGMLTPDTAFAYEADGSDLLNAYNVNMSENYKTVYVVEHTHENFDENGVCDCGYPCPHADVDETGFCTLCGKRFYVQGTYADGTTHYYGTLSDALEDTAVTQAVIIGTLTEECESWDGGDRSVTLDLSYFGAVIKSVRSGHLILRDSSESGSILEVKEIQKDGQVTVESGTVFPQGETLSVYVYGKLTVTGGYVGSLTAMEGSTVSLSGGSFGKIVGSGVTLRSLLAENWRK